MSSSNNRLKRPIPTGLGLKRLRKPVVKIIKNAPRLTIEAVARSSDKL